MSKSSVFQRAEQKALAKIINRKFSPPKEDVERGKVLSAGVVQINGTPHTANTAGFNAGTVIDVVNVKSKGNTHYVAKFGSESGTGNNGLSKALKQQIIDLIESNTSDSANNNATGTPPTDPGGGTTVAMTVSPSTNITDSGDPGDDFTGNSQVYTLTNTGTVSINWSVAHLASWVTISSSSGTLAVSANTTVTVSVNSGASSLLSGQWIDPIDFYAEAA